MSVLREDWTPHRRAKTDPPPARLAESSGGGAEPRCVLATRGGWRGWLRWSSGLSRDASISSAASDKGARAGYGSVAQTRAEKAELSPSDVRAPKQGVLEPLKDAGIDRLLREDPKLGLLTAMPHRDLPRP